MYMTVFKLTRESMLSANNLIDVYNGNKMHQWLTQQFDSSRAKNHILYKVISKQDEIYVYIQSDIDFLSHIENINQYGLIYVKSFQLPIVNDNQILTFDLTTFPNKSSGKSRFFIKNKQDRLKWLKNILEENGFELLDCTEYIVGYTSINKDSLQNTLCTSYRGLIRIINKTKAMHAIQSGIGRFKNYGLGLLLYR